MLVSCVQSSDLIFLWIIRTTKSYYSVSNSIPCAVHCILMTYLINGTLHLSVAFIFFTFFCHPPPPGLPLMAQLVKNLPAMWKTQVGSLGQKDSPGEGNVNPLRYYCLENPHGQRCLVGYSPRSYKESDTTEQLSTAQ